MIATEFHIQIVTHSDDIKFVLFMKEIGWTICHFLHPICDRTFGICLMCHVQFQSIPTSVTQSIAEKPLEFVIFYFRLNNRLITYNTDDKENRNEFTVATCIQHFLPLGLHMWTPEIANIRTSEYQRYSLDIAREPNTRTLSV